MRSVLGGLTLFAAQRLVTAEQWAHTATTITYVRVLGELMLFARQRLVSARAVGAHSYNDNVCACARRAYAPYGITVGKR